MNTLFGFQIVEFLASDCETHNLEPTSLWVLSPSVIIRNKTYGRVSPIGWLRRFIFPLDLRASAWMHTIVRERLVQRRKKLTYTPSSLVVCQPQKRRKAWHVGKASERNEDDAPIGCGMVWRTVTWMQVTGMLCLRKSHGQHESDLQCKICTSVLPSYEILPGFTREQLLRFG